MANAKETVTKEQIKDLAATLVAAIPDLSHEEAQCLIGKKKEVIAAVQETLRRLARSETVAQKPVSPPFLLDDLIVLPFDYEAPRIIADGDVVSEATMLERAKAANATSGQKECEDFLAHQSEIDPALRGKVVFVFVDWRRHPGSPGDVAAVYWGGGRWVLRWGWLGIGWYGLYRPVRRSTKLQ